MNSSNSSLRHDRKGSFLQLIDSLACEIGTLKKEMKKKSQTADDNIDTTLRLGEEVRGLFLQDSPVVRGGARDSGYDSLQRRLGILDKLTRTHTVWLRLCLDHQAATHILHNQPAGTFVVRRSSSLQRKVISVRLDHNSAEPVRDFPVRERHYTFSLEGSCLSFTDLFRLVAFYCISRDVLPFSLKLPEAIAAARTCEELDELAKLGEGFWDARSNQVTKVFATAERSFIKPGVGDPWLCTRTPSELECCQSNGALCFINPLFTKVHQPDRHSLQGEESRQSAEPQTGGQKESGAVDGVPRSPPPRPPPPRLAPQFSARPPRQNAMPEKISWINFPKEKVEERERGGGLLSWLGASLSSSPPKRLSISSPISIPRPSLRRTKASPPSSQDDVQCHAALEDQTIEKALIRARLAQQNAFGAPTPSELTPMTTEEQVDVTGGDDDVVEGGGGGGGGGGQRLSDMSMSTDSSDSLDFSQSSVFFLPPLHDPSPPTTDDLDTHLPLSLPLPPYCGSGEDDEDEDDEDEEEPDYGVSLESDQDQDQDLTLVPPGRRRSKRRPSAGALVLQKALRGNLRKLSGVFNSLLTPEKKATRRVVELSADRTSYFGCLVQDYLAYMGEGGAGGLARQAYASGPELLQTLRQFITQMKSYLRQSSELEPPIESLIPEDQIDRVLEKAMHKCVLKPLRLVVMAALQQFQERSGAWRELKENLALAKARQPQEMGVADALPPDPVAIEKIRHKFLNMMKLYSPEKKVAVLLRVCKLIYTIMEDNSGRLFGADDFLPMLTYVLAQVDLPELDHEVLYMMELLDPGLLHGEGGYYLTSAFGALSLIRNFQEEQAARALSSETRDTLHQWHRRRTAQRSAPSIDDFQNYLRVALQELDSGCTAKTVQVGPYATVEEVCQVCTRKFNVSDPEHYGLFLVTGGGSQQLAADTHPQKIKAELHSRSQATPFHFVFRRVDPTDPPVDPTDPPGPPADLPVESTPPLSGLSPTLRLSLTPRHLHGNSISV